MISEHKADERPSAAPAAGLTRRDFLQRATKAVIAGGVLVGALAAPTQAMANGCKTGDSCGPSNNTCGVNSCSPANTCSTSDICDAGNTCNGNTCSKIDPCTYSNTCTANTCTLINSCTGPSFPNTCNNSDSCGSDSCSSGTSNICEANDSCSTDSCSVGTNKCNPLGGGTNECYTSDSCLGTNICVTNVCRGQETCTYMNSLRHRHV